jgi:hypothetical protein
MDAGGRRIAVNTPITGLDYESRTGRGAIRTGWQQVDVARA